MNAIERLHNFIFNKKIFKLFTWLTRGLLALAFIPSGLTKVLGNRFTLLDTNNPIGYFFEALYQSGFYWNFLGLSQLFAAILIIIPRTSFLGALVFFPIILNITIIVTSIGFPGTPYITWLMFTANIYLLMWDLDKLKNIIKIIFQRRHL